MTRRMCIVLLAAALTASGGTAAFGQPPGTVPDMARAAQLVFRGTVQRAGASNVSILRAADDTAVVRVDQVLKAAASLGDITGREITVKLREPGSVRPGDSAVFFTNGALYGESLGVVEVGRAADGAALRSDVASAVRGAEEEKLRERLERATLVVAGKVVETRPAAEKAPGVTEHDPQWREAVIEIDTVLKGKPEESRVVVVYPTSFDVMWAEAPRPAVGWDAIWLLYRDQISGVDVSGYTALKPWNLQSRDSLPTVRRLLP